MTPRLASAAPAPQFWLASRFTPTNAPARTWLPLMAALTVTEYLMVAVPAPASSPTDQLTVPLA